MLKHRDQISNITYPKYVQNKNRIVFKVKALGENTCNEVKCFGLIVFRQISLSKIYVCIYVRMYVYANPCIQVNVSALQRKPEISW